MAGTRIKKNDMVKVIAGADKGATGKVQFVDVARGKVIVAGINMIKKTKKRRSQEEQGGVISIEAPMNISNVQLLYKNTSTRVGYVVEGNTKKRIAKKTGEELL